MSKASLLHSMKRCGAVLLALVLSAAVLWPTAGSVRAEEVSRKMLCFENAGVQSGFGVHVKVEKDVVYRVSFKYKLETGAFAANNGAGITLRMYNGAFNAVVATSYDANGSYDVSDAGGYRVYTAELVPDTAGWVFPMILANSGGKNAVKLYVADLTVYKAADIYETNLATDIVDFQTLNGWYFKGSATSLSGTEYTSDDGKSTLAVLDYDESLFSAPSKNMVTVKNTAGQNGIAVAASMTAGKTYRVSFCYKLGATSRWDTDNQGGGGISVRMYTDYKMNALGVANYSADCSCETSGRSGWNTYTATLKPTGSISNGRLAILLNSGKAEQELTLSDLVMYEESDSAKTNLLSLDPYAADLTGWYCKSTQGALKGLTEFSAGNMTVSMAERDDVLFQVEADGDVNRDGVMDIADLVALELMRVKGQYFKFGDTNADAVIDEEDIQNERKLLLQVIAEFSRTGLVEPVPVLEGGADAQADSLSSAISSYPDTLTATGTTYYVSEAGDDRNDGSRQHPLRTLAQVARLPLQAGDRVLFMRGSVFRTDAPLTVVSGVSYGAYGSGDKPLILGSLKNYADFSAWSRADAENVWKMPLPGDRQAGVITFDGDESCGYRRYALDTLENNGEYYHDLENSTLYLYLKTRNPGDYFEDIEIGTAEALIGGTGVRNVQIENLDFKYAAKLAADFQYTAAVTVSGCGFSWIGGATWQGEKGDATLRMGNAVQFWLSTVDCTVEYCAFRQIFDAAVTFQGTSADRQRFVGITVRNCLVEYCSMNFEFWGSKPGTSSVGRDTSNTTMENIRFESNFVRFAGYGWGGIQRYDKTNQAVLLGWNFDYAEGSVRGFTVSGNVFDRAACPFLYAVDPLLRTIEFSGNAYYRNASESAVKFSYYGDATPGNVDELAAAVAVFEKAPGTVGWLD